MDKVMSNKSQWLIIGLVVAIALIAIALSQYRYQKLQHNVAALKHNFAVAQNDNQALAAWQGFATATSPTLHSNSANAGFFHWVSKLFGGGGGSSSSSSSTDWSTYNGSDSSGVSDWASYEGSGY